jgi:hypothetical protein
LFGVIIGKDGGGSDNIGGATYGGLIGLTGSKIGVLGGGTADDDQFQFHCCCCCQVQEFQAFGFLTLLPKKKTLWIFYNDFQY